MPRHLSVRAPREQEASGGDVLRVQLGGAGGELREGDPPGPAGSSPPALTGAFGFEGLLTSPLSPHASRKLSRPRLATSMTTRAITRPTPVFTTRVTPRLQPWNWTVESIRSAVGVSSIVSQK